MRYLQNIAHDFKHWHRNVRLFFMANLFFQFGSGIFSVLYNLYIQSLGYSESMNGTIVSMQSLATALTFIPIGFLGDRMSRKNILIVGALFSAVACIWRAYATTEVGLELLAVLAGLVASVFPVIAIPFLADNVPKEERLQLFSYHFSFVLAAQVLGSVSGGALADGLERIGWSAVDSLQTTLMVGGVLSLAAFIPLLLLKEQPKSIDEADAAETPATTEAAPAAETSVAANEPDAAFAKPAPSFANRKAEWKTIGMFTFVQLLIGIGSGLVVPYLNLYFHSRFNVSMTAIGLLISLGQVMTIISMLIGPSLVKRVGPVRAVVTFQILSLPFLLLTGFTNLLIVASISFLFRQALMNAANPIHSTIVVDRVSSSMRGLANSFTQTAFMMGWASMGTVQSYLVITYGNYWGYAIAFCMTGALYVTAALLYLFMFREYKARRVQKV